jgi:hypothetical protein
MKTSHEHMIELRNEIAEAGFCLARFAGVDIEAAIAKFVEQCGCMPDRQTLRDRSMRAVFFDALVPRPPGAPF